MFISRDNVHACAWQLSSVDLLLVTKQHRIKSGTKGRPSTSSGSQCPVLLEYGIFERLMTVTKPGVAHIYCHKRFYCISRPWSDLTVTRSHTTVFFHHFLSLFHFLFLFNCASTFSSSLFRSPTHTLTLSHSVLSLLAKWAEALLLWQSP